MCESPFANKRYSGSAARPHCQQWHHHHNYLPRGGKYLRPPATTTTTTTTQLLSSAVWQLSSTPEAEPSISAHHSVAPVRALAMVALAQDTITRPKNTLSLPCRSRPCLPFRPKSRGSSCGGGEGQGQGMEGQKKEAPAKDAATRV